MIFIVTIHAQHCTFCKIRLNTLLLPNERVVNRRCVLTLLDHLKGSPPSFTHPTESISST